MFSSFAATAMRLYWNPAENDARFNRKQQHFNAVHVSILLHHPHNHHFTRDPQRRGLSCARRGLLTSGIRANDVSLGKMSFKNHTSSEWSGSDGSEQRGRRGHQGSPSASIVTPSSFICHTLHLPYSGAAGASVTRPGLNRSAGAPVGRDGGGRR